MRILYGVAGEGSGHAMRSRVVLAHLIARGHEVRVVAYGRAIDHLRSDFSVTPIAGLHLAYRNNHVRYLPTAFRNLRAFPGIAASTLHVRNLVTEFQPQIICTDFEPVTAMVAHLTRLPLLSIDNQHELTRTRMRIPRQYQRDALAAAAVTRGFVSRARAYIVTTLTPRTPTRPRTFVVPPILRNEILALQPTHGNHHLVYFTAAHAEIIPMLREFPTERFVIYGLDRSGRMKNCAFRKPSSTQFLRDLARCRSVIGNAGFTLVSEALHLGKPYLALPVAAQFEQIANALTLQDLGVGEYHETLTRESLERFLYNRESSMERLRAYPRTDNTEAFIVIDRLIAEHAK